MNAQDIILLIILSLGAIRINWSIIRCDFVRIFGNSQPRKQTEQANQKQPHRRKLE